MPNNNPKGYNQHSRSPRKLVCDVCGKHPAESQPADTPCKVGTYPPLQPWRCPGTVRLIRR